MEWYVLVSPERYSNRSIGAIRIDMTKQEFSNLLKKVCKKVDCCVIEDVVKEIRRLGIKVQYLNPDNTVLIDPWE